MFGTLFHSLQSHLFDKNICFFLEFCLDFSKASSNKRWISNVFKKQKINIAMVYACNHTANLTQHIGNRSHSWPLERQENKTRSETGEAISDMSLTAASLRDNRGCLST